MARFKEDWIAANAAGSVRVGAWPTPGTRRPAWPAPLCMRAAISRGQYIGPFAAQEQHRHPPGQAAEGNQAMRLDVFALAPPALAMAGS